MDFFTKRHVHGRANTPSTFATIVGKSSSSSPLHPATKKHFRLQSPLTKKVPILKSASVTLWCMVSARAALAAAAVNGAPRPSSWTGQLPFSPIAGGKGGSSSVALPQQPPALILQPAPSLSAGPPAAGTRRAPGALEAWVLPAGSPG